MLITPELAGLIGTSLGLLGLIMRKARCFARRIGGKWSYGAGFTESKLIPEFQQDIHIQLGGQRQPIVSGVSSDPTPLSNWRRALSPLADGLASRKLTSGK